MINARDAFKLDEANLRMTMRQRLDEAQDFSGDNKNEAEKAMVTDRAVKALIAMVDAMAAVIDDDCADNQKLPVLALVCGLGSDTLDQLNGMMAGLIMTRLAATDPDFLAKYLSRRF